AFRRGRGPHGAFRNALQPMLRPADSVGGSSRRVCSKPDSAGVDEPGPPAVAADVSSTPPYRGAAAGTGSAADGARPKRCSSKPHATSATNDVIVVRRVRYPK